MVALRLRVWGLQVCHQSVRPQLGAWLLWKMEIGFPPTEAFRSNGVKINREHRAVPAIRGSYQDDRLLEASSPEAKTS